jgi:hypothetical protein
MATLPLQFRHEFPNIQSGAFPPSECPSLLSCCRAGRKIFGILSGFQNKLEM